MGKTKKVRKKKQKTKTKKNRKKLVIGFLNVTTNTPTDKWNVDYFGYRKLIPVNQYKTIQSIDNLNLATDYKKNPKIYKFASEEYRKRLLLLLKNHTPSRKLFEKKTKKKYNSKRIGNIIKKMHMDKVQNLYFFLLEKEKSGKK